MMKKNLETNIKNSGILLVNKPIGKTSFSLVQDLRRRLNIKKIGHAGTLDPLATGVMVMLIGKQYTKLSDKLLTQDKEYIAEITLGITTETYDCEGKITSTCDLQPSLESIKSVLKEFNGKVMQVPPMYSAKKHKGKKLYELARKGEIVERKPVELFLETKLLDYSYPKLKIQVSCSKGTYLRSIAHDIGQKLRCGAHLSALCRIRSGNYHIENCIDANLIDDLKSPLPIQKHIDLGS